MSRRVLHLVRRAPDAAGPPPAGVVRDGDPVVSFDRARSRFERDGAAVDSDALVALLFACDGAIVW